MLLSPVWKLIAEAFAFKLSVQNFLK